MGYWKIIKWLDNAIDQPFKFKTRNWVEVFDDACLNYIVNSKIIFKTTMLKSSFCEQSEAYNSCKRNHNNSKQMQNKFIKT